MPHRLDEYSPFKRHLSEARRRCVVTNRDLEIDVKDLKELWERQDGKCAITGLPMANSVSATQKSVSGNPYRASLDRIDSDVTYTKDNIQFVCTCVNFMKNQYTNEQIVEFVDHMHENTTHYSFDEVETQMKNLLDKVEELQTKITQLENHHV